MTHQPNRFDAINQSVREMSKGQAEARFFECEHSALLSHFEQGSILDHARKTWFSTGEKDKDQASYEAWVLSSLRIPLDKAVRIRRVYGAIQASGMGEDAFRGIPFSSVLFMVPILRSKKFKEEIPGLLELARERNAREVQSRCNEIRGFKPKLPELPNVVEQFRRGDWARCVEILGYIGKVCAERKMSFGFVLEDNPEVSNHKHTFATGDGVRPYWKSTIAYLNQERANAEALTGAMEQPETEIVAYVEAADEKQAA